MAHILNITQKIKQDPTTFVGLQDFAVTAGAAYDPIALINDPTVTLYCFDAATDQAIFVKTPATIDLTKAPFFYQAQYEHATQLVALSKDEFFNVGRLMSPPENPIIMLHSVGRCGSTLLSQVFDALPEMISLSEPDIFSNLLLMRGTNGRSDPQIKAFLETALKLQLKPLPQRQASHWCIKFRSAGIEIADLMGQTPLAVQNIFLYRNLNDQTRSAIRAFDLKNTSPRKINGALLERWVTLVPLLKKYQWQAKWGRLDRIDLSIMAWLSRMDRYLQLYQQNDPIFAVRYEDLISAPEETVKAILKQTGFSETYAAQTMSVFNRDSQAGSKLAQNKISQGKGQELSAKQDKQIRQYLKKHPTINASTYQLPNTVHPKIS